MNVKQYLKRINVENIEKPTLEYLKKLHRNHLYNVPFENQELFTYNSCTVEHNALHEKIVVKKEGGVCYQLNYMFYWLLKELGYSVEILSAKVKETMYDHMLLKVKIDEDIYLCDVGYGLNFLEPIPFIIDKDLKDKRGIFNITKEKKTYTLFAHFYHKIEHLVQYSFKDKEKNIEQFYPRMIYYSTNPNSNFVKELTIILESERTRKVIKNTSLKVGLDDPIITTFKPDSLQKISDKFLQFKIDNLTVDTIKKQS